MNDSIPKIISETLGAAVTNASVLGERTKLLTLSDGRRVVLREGDTRAEARALELLAGEVDLPLPSLVGAGDGWLVRSHLAGTPLPEALDTIGEAGRYALGRDLGAAMQRVHRIRAERYGALAGDDPVASPDDKAYAVRRAEAAIVAAQAANALDDALAKQVRGWFAREYAATGRSPALVHGGLRPEHLLVRAREGKPALTGIVGWENAQGWAPGWDHTRLLDAFADNAFFGLRVGYAEAYDALTQQVDEQTREFALVPYRLLLHLERLPAADPDARAASQRLLAALSGLRGGDNGAADDDGPPDVALTA